MILTLLILIPLLAGILSFAAGSNAAKGLTLAASLATLLVTAIVVAGGDTYWSMPWIPRIGTNSAWLPTA